MEKLKYFVYTSGEERDGQIDWGVKFFSDEFPLPDGKEIHDTDSHEKLIELNNAYTDNVARFGLSGGLDKHSPTGVGFGYIVLPWNEKYTLVGIYANFTDLMKRPNIGLVMAAVPKDVRKHMSPMEVISALLKDNNIMEIAAPRHSEKELKDSPRPKRLLLDGSVTEKDINPDLKVLDGVGWPTRRNTFILNNGKIQKFIGAEPKVEPEFVTTEKAKGKGESKKRKFPIGIVLGGIVVVVLIGGALSAFKKDTAQEMNQPHIQSADLTVKENATVEEDTIVEEYTEKDEEFKVLLDSVMSEGIANKAVVGVATVRKVDGTISSYEVISPLSGDVPRGKIDVSPDRSVPKPGSDYHIVKPDEVKEKLRSILSKLNYWEDYKGKEPAYYIKKDEWEQAVSEIQDLFWLYGTKSEGNIRKLNEDELREVRASLAEILKKLEEQNEEEAANENKIPLIAFFDRPNDTLQSLRIVSLSIDDDNNADVRPFLMAVKGTVAINPNRYDMWLERFCNSNSKQKKPQIPSMQFTEFNEGCLLLYGDDLGKTSESYKKFIDQMIEALVE